MTTRAIKPVGLRVVAKAIGTVTFMEMIRDRILYNIVLFALLLLGVGLLVSKLSFIQPGRVVLDFGVSATELACSMVAIFAGSGMLGREWERRTMHITLSRPVSRAQFVLGKFAGLSMVLLVNWALMCVCLITVLGLTGAAIHSTLLIALFLIFLQSVLLAGVAIFFSTFSTTSLSVVLSIGCYLIGTNISQLRFIAGRLHSSLGSATLQGLALIFPNLEYFNLGHRVTYGLPVEWGLFIGAIGYWLLFTVLLLVIAGALIRLREI